MFHVEIRQSFHTARAFNLSEDELRTGILTDWIAGRTVRWAEREFEPRKAKLTVLSGPELPVEELGMGRGWQEALRRGEDITARMLEGASPAHDFKPVVMALCERAAVTPRELLQAAEDRWPGSRVSERVALAEQAVWELLHEHRLQARMPGDGTPVGAERWRDLLLRTSSWLPGSGPGFVLEAAAAAGGRRPGGDD